MPSTLPAAPLGAINVVVLPRSLAGNQYPVALDERGKAGGTLIPRSIRESKISSNPLKIVVMKLAIENLSCRHNSNYWSFSSELFALAMEKRNLSQLSHLLQM